MKLYAPRTGVEAEVADEVADRLISEGWTKRRVSGKTQPQADKPVKEQE